MQKTNKVIAPESAKIRIYGTGNVIEFADVSIATKLEICIGQPECYANDCHVKIGNGSTFGSGCMLMIMEDQTTVEIGDECMFSDDVEIWASDTHAVFSVDTNSCLNVGKYVFVGNHVWIGKNSVILKNTKISSNSVIGINTVVSGNVDEPNVVIAGNPGKIVKHNINLSRLRPKQYIQSQKS